MRDVGTAAPVGCVQVLSLHSTSKHAAGMAHWLLIRRSLRLPEEYAYYRVYGPETTSLPELVAVSRTTVAD
jgi:hypothetical protein